MLPLFKIGVGTLAWGNQLVWDYGSDFNEASLKELFHKSVQSGQIFFNTSESYSDGESERLLGKFESESPIPVFLSSKYIPRVWRFRRRDFQSQLRESLRRLRRPFLDLYQINPPVGFMKLEMLAECAADAVDEGLVHHIGVSDFTADQIALFAELLAQLGIPLACVSSEYNLLNRSVETNGVLYRCRELSIPLIAQSPLAMGILTGKYLTKPITNGLRRQLMERYPRAGIIGLFRLMNTIGSENAGRNNGQVALNWLIRKNVIPIPGSKTVDQAFENNLAASWEMTEEQSNRLDQYSAEMLMQAGGNDA